MLSIAQKCFCRFGYRLPSITKRFMCGLLAPTHLSPSSLCAAVSSSCIIRFYNHKAESQPISKTSPQLLLYWHPTKNKNITPDDVTVKSFEKAWWKCPKGVDHEWECSVRYALKNDMKTVNCPFCNNKRVSITNSLATRYPEIASQWHPTKNGTLLPTQVTYISNTAVWWQCDKDPSHVWKREVKKRVQPTTATQGLCPFCSGMHPSIRTLDIAYPEIAKEWNYEKNGELLPSDVSKSSSAVVWWRCSRGHEWKTSVNNRTSSHHSGCPICKGREISLERSLAYQYPELAAQWHPTKNLPLTPSSVFPYSKRVVWWVCTTNPPPPDSSEETIEFRSLLGSSRTLKGCGNEWEESIKNRVAKYKNHRNLLCPDCSLSCRKKTTVASSTPKKTAESKNLKKIRVVGGQNDREVIMVSASDYEDLIALGSYEPVEEDIKPSPMKEVYGKRKPLYRHSSLDKPVHGPRMRVVLSDDANKPTSVETPADWLDEDGLVNDLNDLSDIEEFIPHKKRSQKKRIEDEQGWSI